MQDINAVVRLSQTDTFLQQPIAWKVLWEAIQDVSTNLKMYSMSNKDL